MNLFNNAKLSAKDLNKRSCRFCNKLFIADNRNLKRGWGMCCSKSCAKSYGNSLMKMKGQGLKQEIRDLRLDQLGI